MAPPDTPGHPWVADLLDDAARAAWLAGRTGRAVGLGQRAVDAARTGEDRALARARLARYLAADGDVQEAVVRLRSLLDEGWTGPVRWRVALDLGRLLLGLGRADQALEVLRPAFREAGGGADARTTAAIDSALAVALAASGRLDELLTLVDARGRQAAAPDDAPAQEGPSQLSQDVTGLLERVRLSDEQGNHSGSLVAAQQAGLLARSSGLPPAPQGAGLRDRGARAGAPRAMGRGIRAPGHEPARWGRRGGPGPAGRATRRAGWRAGGARGGRRQPIGGHPRRTLGGAPSPRCGGGLEGRITPDRRPSMGRLRTHDGGTVGRGRGAVRPRRGRGGRPRRSQPRSTPPSRSRRDRGRRRGARSARTCPAGSPHRRRSGRARRLVTGHGGSPGCRARSIDRPRPGRMGARRPLRGPRPGAFRAGERAGRLGRRRPGGRRGAQQGPSSSCWMRGRWSMHWALVHWARRSIDWHVRRGCASILMAGRQRRRCPRLAVRPWRWDCRTARSTCCCCSPPGWVIARSPVACSSVPRTANHHVSHILTKLVAGAARGGRGGRAPDRPA